jgi:hypothetical protein
MFADLMHQRKLARYLAFDLLWLNGEDLKIKNRSYSQKEGRGDLFK